MKTERTMTRSLIRVLLVTGAVLSIPLVASQLAEDVDWSLFDFVLAGGLLVVSGLLFELGAKMAGKNRAGSRISAVVTGVLAAMGGATAVVGAFDDAPGLILFGGLLGIGAVVLGLWTVHRETEAKASFARLLLALAIPGLAGLGGAAVIFSEIDDAPGGILMGMLMMIGAVVLAVRVGGAAANDAPSA